MSTVICPEFVAHDVQCKRKNRRRNNSNKSKQIIIKALVNNVTSVDDEEQTLVDAPVSSQSLVDICLQQKLDPQSALTLHPESDSELSSLSSQSSQIGTVKEVLGVDLKINNGSSFKSSQKKELRSSPYNLRQHKNVTSSIYSSPVLRRKARRLSTQTRARVGISSSDNPRKCSSINGPRWKYNKNSNVNKNLDRKLSPHDPSLNGVELMDYYSPQKIR